MPTENDTIYDSYAVAMLTGIGSKLAEMALSGTIEPTVMQRIVSTGMQAARAAYDVRDDYRPDKPPDT